VITYAVVGRDEERTLEVALRQALDAAGPGDEVWFVDSASVDGSVDVARRLGVEVMAAPAGKGRAVAAAVARCDGGLLCLVDADIMGSTRNIPAALRDRWLETGADMVIGDFAWPRRRLLSITIAVHTPLVRALFPECLEVLAPQPLSGFRLLDTSLPLGGLPAGYGLECHLNVHVASSGGRIAWADLGTYDGPVIFRETMAPDIAEAILDVAEEQGRIEPSERAQWDAWIQPVLELIATSPSIGEDGLEDYKRQLVALADRPTPSVRASAVPSR
jgi:glucosyl-3-phosphoglycerate synthase